MRLPISWLREFVALPSDTAEIAERLAALGFPVAEIERRPQITGVVVGRIETLEKHPNADRLQVAQIDAGAERPLTIATAATNVAQGQTIAVATIGARLPQLVIAPRTMRGIASEGMMISAEELALPAEWFEDGIMQLEASCAPGANVVELFGLDADVLDVEITANRPDAMSVIGLARELAASYGVALRLPPLTNPGTQDCPPEEAIEIVLESPDVRRFVSQRIDAVRVGVAPAWMRVRLALAGQRPINNVVDVSNYVMLETGQPLHFYDAAKIRGKRLIVRDARDGERVVTLDGADRTLTPQALVIADEERTLCLAGLMGAQAGEVNETTTAIVLEAANFNGARVRRMSGALALRSEASSRHEKPLAPALTDLGAARAATLLRDFGAMPYRPRAYGDELRPAAAIALPVAEVERILGLAISAQRIEEHLTALGCEVQREGDRLSVTPPPWRRDLAIPADLVEEVARVEGYERIPAIVPSVAPHEISSAEYELENRVAHLLEGLRYNEVLTQSLRDEGSVEVRNPLSETQRLLRDSLVPGALEYLARGAQPVRIFEIGDVFAWTEDGLAEQSLLAFGFSADPLEEPSWRDTPFLQLKGDCELLVRRITGCEVEARAGVRKDFHPGKTAILTVAGSEIGYLGARGSAARTNRRSPRQRLSLHPRPARLAGIRDAALSRAVEIPVDLSGRRAGRRRRPERARDGACRARDAGRDLHRRERLRRIPGSAGRRRTQESRDPRDAAALRCDDHRRRGRCRHRAASRSNARTVWSEIRA